MHARLKAGAGFTIVETMIFLAISALMFILAIGAMSGKQQQTEFNTSVGTLKSELNLVLSNVSNGNYIDQVGGQYIVCNATVSGTVSISLSLSPPTSVNNGCTVIGEVIEFSSNSSGQIYYVVPVFGCNYAKCNSANGSSTNITQAEPTMSSSVYQATAMPFGLTIDTSSGNTPGAFAVFSLENLTNNVSGSSTSGLNHVELFQIPNLPYSSSNTLSDLASQVNNLYNCTPPLSSNDVCTSSSASEAIDPTAGLSFCVDSGTSDNQSAEFTLGGSNSPTALSDKIYNGKGC